MNLLRIVDFIFPPSFALAHCDIPCGVYDPKPAQMSADAVLKMVEKIEDPPEIDEKDPESRMSFHNNMTRFVIVKEQEAEKCKREVLILWTDFFKQEHLEKWPDLHEKVWKTTKLCSENKRNVSLNSAKELVIAVNEIANIFTEAQKDQKR